MESFIGQPGENQRWLVEDGGRERGREGVVLQE